MNENTRASQFREQWKSILPLDHVHNLIDSYRGGVKPYDCLVLHKGKYIGIEFKRITGLSINPKDGLRDNQSEGLFEVVQAKGTGLVIYFLDHKDWTNQYLFVCTIQQYVKIFNGVGSETGVWEWGNTRKLKELQEEYPHCFLKKCKSLCHKTNKQKLVWPFHTIIHKFVRK